MWSDVYLVSKLKYRYGQNGYTGDRSHSRQQLHRQNVGKRCSVVGICNTVTVHSVGKTELQSCMNGSGTRHCIMHCHKASSRLQCRWTLCNGIVHLMLCSFAFIDQLLQIFSPIQQLAELCCAIVAIAQV